MNKQKEMTARTSSVGADTEQPIRKNTTSSISENGGNIKSFEELQREMPVSYTHLDVYKRQKQISV